MADRDGPDIKTLLALFPPGDYLSGYEEVPAEQVPEPYHRLLVHEHHMTVTVEEYHGDLVDVVVLDERRIGESYARRILLALQQSRQIVQFGLVRIHFQYCSEAVRDEIVSKKTPLGRILINHNVLRRIEPTAFLRITLGPEMQKWFGTKKTVSYGRLAIIHCDEQPAIELLEIVAP